MKRKLQLFIAFGISIFMLSACSNVFYPKADVLGKIKRDMTTREVTELLGNPDYRRINYDLEEWEYQKQLSVLDKPTTIIVRFENGHLIYMDSYPTPIQPTPHPSKGEPHKH